MAKIGKEHVIGENEICVCLPGLVGGLNQDSRDIYAGGGYEDGRMAKIDRDKSWRTGESVDALHVYWSRNDFVNNHGVYAKAVRRATPTEVAAYNLGARNIKEIDKSFTISYTTSEGVTEKVDIKTFDRSEAETLLAKQLGEAPTINYVFEK